MSLRSGEYLPDSFIFLSIILNCSAQEDQRLIALAGSIHLTLCTTLLGLRGTRTRLSLPVGMDLSSSSTSPSRTSLLALGKSIRERSILFRGTWFQRIRLHLALGMVRSRLYVSGITPTPSPACRLPLNGTGKTANIVNSGLQHVRTH